MMRLTATTEDELYLPQRMGQTGAVLLMIGLLAPVVHGPSLGGLYSSFLLPRRAPFIYSQSYMQVGHGEQLAVLAIGILALGLASFRFFKPLYFLGAGALCLV